jgi:hypothetical protein
MPTKPTLTLYWVYENDFARREYYRDSGGGIHIKTIWKRLHPITEELT